MWPLRLMCRLGPHLCWHTWRQGHQSRKGLQKCMERHTLSPCSSSGLGFGDKFCRQAGRTGSNESQHSSNTHSCMCMTWLDRYSSSPMLADTGCPWWRESRRWGPWRARMSTGSPCNSRLPRSHIPGRLVSCRRTSMTGSSKQSSGKDRRWVGTQV